MRSESEEEGSNGTMSNFGPRINLEKKKFQFLRIFPNRQQTTDNRKQTREVIPKASKVGDKVQAKVVQYFDAQTYSNQALLLKKSSELFPTR